MFGKLLIANRGEIACRVARTARRLGIRTVAVYSDVDASAAHVAACDEAVHIGGARPAESYLRADAILAAAHQVGADAIHPGYGFLSENADFARACAQAGIVFVGPSPGAIDAMGSKSAAKALMEAAGVPLTPGYHGERQEPDYLLEQASRIGYPVLIKAVSGGGGKGMRRVDRAEDFAAALASCQRESQAAFGDARVLVEKYLSPARHIEVQVFGDRQGNVVHLFERDCSVQRRHQKVVEEAPAPGMTPDRRRRMGEAAVAAARAVDYAGAGTVEFIVASDGTFYFMEMNTRLQVEHPVTEMITGLDLVEWQLRVAAGEPLPRRQEELEIRGHALEARIYAEDPAGDFLPSIGRLEYLATPPVSESVRVDTGVRQGDDITPYYDPMIAKLIVHGESRDAALLRMRQALDEFRVVGVRTNVEFLRRLMRAPSFSGAQLDTALIERESHGLFAPTATAAPVAWKIAALSWWWTLLPPPSDASPWECRDGWRLVGAGRRQWKFRHDGLEKRLSLWSDARQLMLEMDGQVETVEGTPGEHGLIEAVVAGEPLQAHAHRSGRFLHLFVAGEHRVFEWLDPYLPESIRADRHGGLAAPMPGRVIAVLVKPGQRVAARAPLLVMEAMKMEHTLTAPADGTVVAVHCEPGEQVREGTELLEFE